MHWWQYSLLGAAGGMLVEVLAIFKWLATWQSARRTVTGRVKGSPPRLRTYIDLPVHGWMAVLRMIFGAGAAVLFGATGQINGPYVAVALGFAAPSMLAQLGTIPQVAAVIRGDNPELEVDSRLAATRGPRPQGVKSEAPSER